MTYFLVLLTINTTMLALVYTHMKVNTRHISNAVISVVGLITLIALFSSNLAWYESVGIYIAALLPNWIFIAYRGLNKYFQDAMLHTH